MEEHRYTTPTHVREFTRYRAHVDFSQDFAPVAPDARAERPEKHPAAAADDVARGPGAADPLHVH